MGSMKDAVLHGADLSSSSMFFRVVARAGSFFFGKIHISLSLPTVLCMTAHLFFEYCGVAEGAYRSVARLVAIHACSDVLSDLLVQMKLNLVV
jgi:hypothetical protein